MGQTTIIIKCTDQTLETIEAPTIASGGFNEDKVLFEFCPLWDGFTKTATFYVKKGETYFAELDSNNTCIIPHEVLEKVGNMFFGVVGVNAAGVTRTSEVLKYKIVQGAISDAHKPSDPTPDIYAQILAKLDALTTGGVTVDSELSDTSTNPVQNKVVTAVLNDKVGSEALREHTANVENPHAVSASQIGALPIDGGTMTGGIQMNGNSILGLKKPTSADEPATKSYVDETFSQIPTDGGSSGAEDITSRVTVTCMGSEQTVHKAVDNGNTITILAEGDSTENAITISGHSGILVGGYMFAMDQNDSSHGAITPLDSVVGAFVSEMTLTYNGCGVSNGKYGIVIHYV